MKCKYCGEDFTNKSIQSLRAHLRWCRKKPETVVTSIRWTKEERDAFAQVMSIHGLTECQGLRTIANAIVNAVRNNYVLTIDARPESKRLELMKGPNPLIVNIEKLQPTYIGFPRRPKVPVDIPRNSFSCPKCGSDNLRHKPFRRFGIYDGSYYECMRCKHYFSRWG